MARKLKLKRTSMWMPEDLLKQAADAAAQDGVSRTVYIQQAIRIALGKRPIASPPQRPRRRSDDGPAAPDTSVFA